MLTTEQKQQFSDILEELGQTLDISETQFNAAVQSYNAVAKQLSKEGSMLEKYKPEIRPQGSFLLGTMIKPINEDDDVDIDLVCELHGKNEAWTQKVLKDNVGLQLKENDLYKTKVKLKNGRRCWTLYYRETSDDPTQRYHLDVLPSIIDSNYIKMFAESYSAIKNINDLAIRITDKKRTDYPTETNHQIWLKSNPIGYGKWFFSRADISKSEVRLLSEAVQPVPKFRKEKLPLQRVVQILKRHRDMMFNGDEDKPISIIITTLAAKAYNQEANVIDALVNVVQRMPDFIDDWYSMEHNKWIKKVANPVNEEENFADKWVDHPQRQKNFENWLKAVQRDLDNILGQRGKGLQFISESMSAPFGKDAVTKAFSNYGENLRKQRERGGLNIAAKTGMIGTTGSALKNHNFYGTEEQ
ncbi:MAG: nucleotidyltransferase [Chitinophagaceae bacterium]|nr:nucleotidyltransferase [Chitinophagaceae bacterium]